MKNVISIVLYFVLFARKKRMTEFVLSHGLGRVVLVWIIIPTI